MLKVGITGGIGSGKSVVSSILKSLGYPVFNSDEISKSIVNADSEVRAELTALFGEDLYLKGELNKVRLAQIIFAEDTAREKVNSIIHPRVREKFDAFVNESNSKIVFNEAAIFFETGAFKKFDKMILVTADDELKIRRVMRRDGLSENDVKARMSKQWTDDKKIPLADFVIINNEQKPLLNQIEKILSELSHR